MIALSESGSIFYTDIVALWTIPAALYILLRIKNTSFQKRWIRCCVAAAVLAFGTWTKPQVAVSVIALCNCSLHCLGVGYYTPLRKWKSEAGSFGRTVAGVFYFYFFAANFNPSGVEYSCR